MMVFDHNELNVAQILLELPEIIQISYSSLKEIGWRLKRKRSFPNENLPKQLSLSSRESTEKGVIYKKIANVGRSGNDKVKALKLKPRKKKVSRILENEEEKKAQMLYNVQLLQLFPCHPDRKTECTTISGNDPPNSSNIISSHHQWSKLDLRLTL